MLSGRSQLIWNKLNDRQSQTTPTDFKTIINMKEIKRRKKKTNVKENKCRIVIVPCIEIRWQHERINSISGELFGFTSLFVLAWPFFYLIQQKKKNEFACKVICVFHLLSYRLYVHRRISMRVLARLSARSFVLLVFYCAPTFSQ